VVRALAESAGASRVEAWFYGERAALYTGMVGERRVSFAHVLVGAAGTVMMMEEMIACGARVFWGLGTAGSLQSDITIGTCLIPTAGISEEGTSRHYVADNAVIGPSPRLVAAAEEACRLENIPFHTGTLWTTDAPYRETMAKIEAYGRQGVLGVDMETSAMYALGQVRGVEVCNVLVVSDELCHEWRPAFGKDELREARSAAGRAILCAIALL
jgi:uridine phosphorylase